MKKQIILIWAKPLIDAHNVKELVDPSLGEDYDRAVDMAGGLATIAAIKNRLEFQSILPINASGDRISSSATMINCHHPKKLKKVGKGKVPRFISWKKILPSTLRRRKN
ncbi:hypothetical protein HN51_044324 [Arachis hypogaea]